MASGRSDSGFLTYPDRTAIGQQLRALEKNDPRETSLRTNAHIKIINTQAPLHLENFPATLEFLAAMSNGSQTRSLLPNSHEIPVGIIISILVIVPGPA